MATNYGERMARLEEKTDNIEKKVDVILNKLENLDNRYPTRREFAVANWVVGIALTLIGFYIAVVK